MRSWSWGGGRVDRRGGRGLSARRGIGDWVEDTEERERRGGEGEVSLEKETEENESKLDEALTIVLKVLQELPRRLL